MKKLLLMLFGVLFTLPAFSQTFEYTYGDFTLKYEIIGDNEVEIVKHISGIDYNKPFFIPSTVEFGNRSYNVVRIGSRAFFQCFYFFNVIIPSTVREIGSGAFLNCAVESVSIPNSVISIGVDAFNSCYSLTSVGIPASVTEIGYGAFSDCTKLTSISVSSDNMNYIATGNVLFNKDMTEILCCPASFTSFSIPTSVTSIAPSAFSGCEYLSSVTIPQSVTSIGRGAFNRCSNLISIDIPKSVTSIGGSAFSQCISLTSIDIPSSVTSIGRGAFYECSSLTRADFASMEALCSIEFNDELSNPLAYARNLYINDEKVTDVLIPDSISSIGAYTFICCNMTSVVIPKSINSIGEGAFRYCSSLTRADFASMEALCSIEFNDECSNPLTYAHNLYINDEKVTDVLIPDSFSSIGAYILSGCNMTSVVIPESINSIGKGAFYCCSSISSIDIPSSVTKIGDKAFLGCSSLVSAEIPDSVTDIGDYSFANGDSLTSIEIPSSVTKIGDHAFYGCENLRSVYYAANNPISGDNDPFFGYNQTFSWETYVNATLYVPEEALEACKEIDPWRNFTNIMAYDPSGIENIYVDFDVNLPYEVYTTGGIKVGNSTDNLSVGMYIIRQGSYAKKIVIK